MSSAYKKIESQFIDSLWSGRRDSNSRQPAWKADALPTELLPQIYLILQIDSTINYFENQEVFIFFLLIL